jgi:transcriptional regulator with XRE-family HTH domain
MARRIYPNLAAYLDGTKQTQAQLASRLRKSQAYISKLVNGIQQPPLDEALKISRACGVPVESLVSRDNAITEGK